MGKFLFLGLSFFAFLAWGEDPGAQKFLLKGLSGLSDLQSFSDSCLKEPKFSSQCSNTLTQLVKDDANDRLLVFESMAPSCRKTIESMRATKTKGIRDFSSPELLQKAFATNKMNHLGEFSHQSAKACLLRAANKNNDVVSKFYYYATRLNEASGKIAQEQAIIDRYLQNKTSSVCPSEQLLTAAHEACQKAQSCSNPESLNQLAQRVKIEEELYEQTAQALSKLAKNCDQNESCRQEKSALSAVAAGLLAKNPWFVNADFNTQKKRSPVKERLENYFKLSQENLKKQQALLHKASMCIHFSNEAECKTEEVREILSLTPDLPDVTGGTTDSERILNEYMNYQRCLEDGSLTRNRASGIVGDAVKSAGLGLIALPIGARWAAGKAGQMVFAEASVLLGADVAVNVLSSQDSWKAMADKCFSADQIDFQFKKLSTQQICENPSSSLSQGQQEKSACLMNAGLSALSALPFVGTGYNVVRYAKTSGLFKAAAPVKDTAALSMSLPTGTATLSKESTAAAGQNSTAATGASSVNTSNTSAASGAASATKSETKVVATDVAKPHNRVSDKAASSERRLGGALTHTSSASMKAEKNVDLAVAPNLPESLRIVEVEKVDGTKALYYKSAVQTKDGTWKSSMHEFQLDEVTGALNANYPAGRELFEKIAQEKAGKAYLAFFDVGSLGFVNKSFKAGEQAGDRYLKGVADKIKEIGAGKVTLARTGGDEFGFIIDEPDPVKAKALVVKIQKAIRKDFDGDAKLVFREEKVSRVKEAREALKKLEAENPQGVTAEQKRQALRRIEEISRIQQPDVSIGITQIGTQDNLNQMFVRAEKQAQKMKISTALKNSRSAKKYKSIQTPSAKPDPRYLAPVEDIAPSPSWRSSPSSSRAPSVDSLKPITSEPKEEVLRIADMSLVRFEDELGRSSFKTERFITDATGKRVPVISDIPTRGSSGLLDGTHTEGQRLLTGFISASPTSYLVMPKLRSLKYLNYFESGTQAGDEILEAVGEIIKKNTRPSDLNFKLGGADFLMGVNNRSTQEMQPLFARVKEQLKTHPKVLAVLEREKAALTAKLERAKSLSLIAEAQEAQKQLQDLKNFNFDLQFETLPRTEIPVGSTLKDIQKKFDDQFDKANPN